MNPCLLFIYVPVYYWELKNVPLRGKYSSDYSTLESEVAQIPAHSLRKIEWNKFTTLSAE